MFILVGLCLYNLLGGGGAFFLACSFEVEISLRTLIPLFTPELVHSGSASCDDCDQVFPEKLRVSSFPDTSDRVPTMP